MEAGVDSLAATELSSRLRSLTGVALSPTLIFEQPTARAIAAHLVEEASSSGVASLASITSIGEARWQLHVACGDAVSSVPLMRWVLNDTQHMNVLTSVQAVCVRHGGFVAGAQRFEAAAFGLSPAEACALPAQLAALTMGSGGVSSFWYSGTIAHASQQWARDDTVDVGGERLSHADHGCSKAMAQCIDVAVFGLSALEEKHPRRCLARLQVPVTSDGNASLKRPGWAATGPGGYSMLGKCMGSVTDVFAQGAMSLFFDTLYAPSAAHLPGFGRHDEDLACTIVGDAVLPNTSTSPPNTSSLRSLSECWGAEAAGGGVGAMCSQNATGCSPSDRPSRPPLAVSRGAEAAGRGISEVPNRSTFDQGVNRAGGSDLPNASTSKQGTISHAHPGQHLDGALVYRRRASPWCERIGSSSIGRSTAMYATCWAPLSIAHATSMHRHVLLATHLPAPLVGASAPLSQWRAIAVLLDECHVSCALSPQHALCACARAAAAELTSCLVATRAHAHMWCPRIMWGRQWRRPWARMGLCARAAPRACGAGHAERRRLS